VAAGSGTLYRDGFESGDVGSLLRRIDLTTSPATGLTERTHNAADEPRRPAREGAPEADAKIKV